MTPINNIKNLKPILQEIVKKISLENNYNTKTYERKWKD